MNFAESLIIIHNKLKIKIVVGIPVLSTDFIKSLPHALKDAFRNNNLTIVKTNVGSSINNESLIPRRCV